MRTSRFTYLAAAILAVNVIGLVWIHHDLTRLPAPQFRVLSAGPASAVQKADRLTLVLNEPLAPPDRVGQPLDRPPFAIQPAAAGHWQWGAPDKLEYLLDKPLLPGRTYYVKPSANLEAQLGRQLAGTREFRFETDSLQLVSCRLGTLEPQVVHVELTFNQPVGPDDLLRHLIVTDAVAASPNGPRAKLETSCLTNQVSERFVLRAARPASQRLHVLIAGKLTGFGAELALGKDFEQDLQAATHFALQGATVTPVKLEKDLTVVLTFTNTLDSAQKLPEVTVSPSVEGLKVSRGKSELLLEGPFVCGKRYTASVAGTLLSADKQTLKEKATATFDVPDRLASLEFTESRGILSPQGNLLLDLKAVNIPGIQVGASRLYANNLVAHVRGGRAGQAEMTSRTLKPHTFKLDLPRNVPQTVAVDLRKLLQQPMGVYRVSASSTDEGWNDENAVITISDLGMTVKQHKEGYTAWVVSLRTGKPVENVKVSAITLNNQVLATTPTGPDGLTTLAVPPNHPDGKAFLIVAEKDSDLSYVRLKDHPWDDEDYIGDRGRAIPSTYDAMLYGDRGVYRPGETVHLTGIVRDAIGRIPPPMPLALRVERPDGKVVATMAIPPDTSGQGVFHADFTPPEDAQMGTYHFFVCLPGDKKPLGACQVLVEAFMPVRMEVKATAAKALYGPKESPEVEVSARYLFGLQAAELPAQVHGHYRGLNFTCAKYPDYVFDSNAGAKKDALPVVQARTDAKGQFKATLQGPNSPGFWQGSFVATVTETGGRSVSSSFNFQVDEIGSHVGLRMPPGAIVGVAVPAGVEWVFVDSQGNEAKADALEWTLDRVEWDWVVELQGHLHHGDGPGDGRPVWKNQERLIPSGTGKLAGGPSGKFDISCPEPGRYRLTVRDPLSGTATEHSFYASRGSDASTTVSKAEGLELVLDRKSYAPGGSAKVLVRAPFSGQLLLTLETDRLLETRVVEMTGRQLELDLPVPPDLRGGAFLTASLVRPVDPEAAKWLPHRAIGMVRLETDHSAARMGVSIVAPAKIEPGQKVSVTVKTDKSVDSKRPAVVHLWAVDEGILLTTGYRVPDAHRYFFMPRMLGVETFDLYQWLMPDYKRPAEVTRIGADGGDDSYLRRSPVPMRAKASTVLWNKTVPVDAEGQATVTLDVPKFTGELRLMAVAVDHDRYGAEKKALTVSSPLLVESSWPRFAAPGDRFKVPVKLFNTTAGQLNVSADLMAKGPISLSLTPPASQPAREPATAAATAPSGEVSGIARSSTRRWIYSATRAAFSAEVTATPASQPTSVPVAEEPLPPAQQEVHLPFLALPAGTSKIVWVYATATDLGPVKVSITASGTRLVTAPNIVATDEARFTIRPVVPLTAETKMVKFEAGTPQTIEPLGDFLAGRTTVSISGRPDVQLRPAIEQLIDYPYGCVEQTTSRLYAILHAPGLLAIEGEGETRTGIVKDMVQAGIARLWSMQTRDGGLGYWPGDSHSNLWGTAYAAGFLVRAKKAGFAVDKRFADSLADYLELALKQTETSEADDNMRALLCNGLATFGRPSESWMNRLADNLDKLDIAGRANLASAWTEMGKKDRAAAMLAADTLDLKVGLSAGGRITSSVSQQAVLLDTLLDLDPSHDWVPLLVGRLEEARKQQGRWASTHDSAMCLAALAHYQTLAKDKPSDFTGTVKMPGIAATQPGGKEFSSAKPFRAQSTQPSGSIEIQSAGSGTLYAVITTEGLRRGKKFETFDRKLQVRRTWKDAAGNAIDPTAMYVGQLVRVEVTLQLMADAGCEFVDNVAIVDALPGGLEVENPKLATSGGGAAGTPDRTQFMDDRVVIFCSANTKVQSFTYCLRVTTAGLFEVPPIQASCMYEPGIASTSGGGTVRVSDTMPPRPVASAPASGPSSRPASGPASRTATRQVVLPTGPGVEAPKPEPAVTPPQPIPVFDGGTDSGQGDDEPADDEEPDSDEGPVASVVGLAPDVARG